MFEKKKRIVDKKLLKEIKTRPCVVCGIVPSDPDHIITKGSGGDDTEVNIWPLCRRHHTDKHQVGLRRFIAKHPRAYQELSIRKGFEEIIDDAKEIIAGQLDLFKI